jgi:hypothetical protein
MYTARTAQHHDLEEKIVVLSDIFPAHIDAGNNPSESGG